MEYQWGSLLPLKETYFGRIDNFEKFKEENPSFWYVSESLDPKNDVPEGLEIIEEAQLQLHDKGVRYTLWKLQSKEWYNGRSRGVAQLVARTVRDCEVARSNRVAPTILFYNLAFGLFLLLAQKFID